MGWEAILGLGFSIALKLLEFFLDRSKLTKEQQTALLELIKESQKVPVSSTKIKEMLSSAKEDIRKQEEELRNKKKPS